LRIGRGKVLCSESSLVFRFEITLLILKLIALLKKSSYKKVHFAVLKRAPNFAFTTFDQS
jgi:hypothetical protein